MSYRKDEASIDEDYMGNGELGLVIVLPHSCDDWVIGSPDEARQLVADLEILIPELEAQLKGGSDE